MSFEIVNTSVVSRSEGWLSAWVGKEHVMMSADTGTCISLSETGGRIWELMEQPRAVHDICKALAEEYEAQPAELQADVVAFLERLSAEHAVVVAS